MAETALLLGTAASIGGSLYKGYSAKQQGNQEARIAGYNADLSRQQGEFQAQQFERSANEERAAGGQAAQEQRYKNAQVISTIRANAAASGGGGLETPSVHDIMSDTIARGEYLTGLDIYGGESRARGRLDQAAVARAGGVNQANVELMQGAAAKSRGKNAFTGSILDSIGEGAGAFYKYDTLDTKRKKAAGGYAGDYYDPTWSNTTVTRN